MIKQFDNELYQTICSWWQSHKWPILPQETLPKRGYVAFIGEKPIIAGFLLKYEDSHMGVFTFPVANPEANHDERTVAFKELIDHVSKVSEEIGIKALITPTNNKSFGNRLEINGFKKHDENVIHYMKEILCPQH